MIINKSNITKTHFYENKTPSSYPPASCRIILRFAQVTVNFTVDMTGQTIGSGGMHVAGQFATAGSTTITQDWQPDAVGSEMTLLGNNVYSVNVDFPEALAAPLFNFCLSAMTCGWMATQTSAKEMPGKLP
jgi:hypothetical protein